MKESERYGDIEWEPKMRRQLAKDRKKYVLTTANMNQCAKSFTMAFSLPVILSLLLIYFG